MDTTVRATCPQCRTVLRIPAQWVGQAVKCKKCGTVVRSKPKGGAAVPAADPGVHQNGNAPEVNEFDFNQPSPDDDMFPLPEPIAPPEEVDDRFDPTGGADVSSQPAELPQPAAPQPGMPPGYPYPMPPGYPAPGYGPPPGYPYGPPPGYPYGAPPGYPPGAPPGYGPPPGYPQPGAGAPPGYPYGAPGYPPPGYGPPPGYPYGAPPGYPYGPPPGAPPAPGMPGAPAPGTGVPGMPPAAPGVPHAASTTYPPAPQPPTAPPAPKISTPPAPVMPQAPATPSPNGPAKPGMPAKPGAAPTPLGAQQPKPAAPPAPGKPAPIPPSSEFKTGDSGLIAANTGRYKQGSGKSKMIWVAVCLVLTGGLVTGAIFGAKMLSEKYSKKEIDPAKLVEQLGSSDTKEREHAAKALHELGAKAEQALRDGAGSSNPEIAKRSKELLATLGGAAPGVAGPGQVALKGAFPRRMLFVHISKYMFLNPLTAGQAGGEDRSKGAAIRLANEWNIPYDPKDNERNQLFVLSDTARPDTPKGDVQNPMKVVVTGAYEQFFATSRAQDRIVFYFGGHALEKDGKAYIAPIEGDLDDPEPTLIPLSDIYDKLKACKATQKVVIWDVCRYNPQRGRQRPGSEPMSETLYKSLAAAPPGVEVVITCQPGENALEFFNLQIDAGATATAPKYAGSAFLSAMQYVAAKSIRAKQPTQVDPIPVAEWSTAVANRVKDMATSPVVGAKQTVKAEGKPPANWVAFNSDEPLAKRFDMPTAPRGTNPADVASIVNEFNVPSIKLDLIDAGLSSLPFRDEIMKDYKAEVPLETILKDKETYKFQAKTYEALDKIRSLWRVTAGAAGGPQMRDDFKAPVTEALKTEIKKEQDFWAFGVADLEVLNLELDGLAAQRDSQTKRWQAHYDYARATVKARLAFMNEYNKLMGDVLTETLPARDEKLGQDRYKLVSSEKMKSKKDIQALAAEAKEAYEKLVTEHKGTPWAIQAKRDKSFALGLAWQPVSSGDTTDTPK